MVQCEPALVLIAGEESFLFWVLHQEALHEAALVTDVVGHMSDSKITLFDAIIVRLTPFADRHVHLVSLAPPRLGVA